MSLLQPMGHSADTRHMDTSHDDTDAAAAPTRRRLRHRRRPRRSDRRLRRTERGANLVEYAMLIALVVVVCVAGVTRFGQEVPASGFYSISNAI